MIKIFSLILALFLTACAEDFSAQNSSNLDIQDIGDLSTSLEEKVELDDLVLDVETYEELFVFEEDSSETESLLDSEAGVTGAHNKRQAKLWPNGIIPVQFAANVTNKEKSKFFKYCKIWGESSKIQCVNRGSHSHHLYVTRSKYNDISGACFAEYGYKKNRRTNMWLPGGCWNQSVILHELGHVIGLMHEHQRPDRDSFLSINWNNIKPEFKYAFEKLRYSDTGERTSFDFNSIMMYGSKSFSQNGKKTIQKRNGGSWSRDKSLSQGDRQIASILYPKSNSGVKTPPVNNPPKSNPPRRYNPPKYTPPKYNPPRRGPGRWHYTP